MKDQYNRFKDALWFSEEKESCVVGGAGGIGSWLVILLARAGFKIHLYDFDDVEDHNRGGQLYRTEDVGKPKVEAISDVCEAFCDTEINIYNEKLDINSMAHKYTFGAFDNMAARKDIFDLWKTTVVDNPDAILIDGRLAMESLQIFCVTPSNMHQYEEHLFPDSDVEEQACTLKQTSHTAAIIGGLMTAFFTNHITNVMEDDMVRRVPFYYEMFLPMTLTEDKDEHSNRD